MTRQQYGPKLEILQTAINTCLVIILSLWLLKKKIIPPWQELRHLPENDNSYLDTMTGTNSSYDRLILCQMWE